jgi:hypothetical protein
MGITTIGKSSYYEIIGFVIARNSWAMTVV